MNDFQRDERTGLWKWPVLLNDDWSKHSSAPCAVLFGRSRHFYEPLKHVVGFDLPARWPHLQMFTLGENLLVLAQGYLQERALLLAEDVNRQLQEVPVSPHEGTPQERALTWGMAFPEGENWDLSNALAEAFYLAQQAEEDARIGSINIANSDWQDHSHDEFVVCARRDRWLTEMWSWPNVAAIHFDSETEPLALLLGDIDRFANFNCSLGHHVGDESLRSIGRILQSIESVDVASFRFGGDEFLVLARGFDFEHTEQIAEDINVQLREVELSHPSVHGTFPLPTITWGVVCSTDVQLETMLRQADELMMATKASKRAGSINS